VAAPADQSHRGDDAAIARARPSIDAREPERVEAIRAAMLYDSRRADAALVSVLAYEGLRPGQA